MLYLQLSPRWCKVVRDLSSNKMRTGLVVLSIAVGVMCIGIINRSQTLLARNLQSAHLATNPYHAILFPEEFDETLVHAIARAPGVGEAEGRQVISVRLNQGPDQWQQMQLIAIANFADIQVNKVWPLAGAWPPPKRTLLLERASLTFLGSQIGDSVQIQLPNGQERILQISGQVHDLSQPPTLFSGELYGYITLDTLTLLGWEPTFNQLYITVSEQRDNREHILAITTAVKEQIERSGHKVYADFVPEPGEHWSHNDLQSMVFLLTALGVLALFLSGFLVTNTISALLIEQVRQIGIMKALGARRYQLIGIYMGAVCLYGLLALVIALPLGVLGAQALTRYVAGLLNFDLVHYTIAPRTLALEITVGLLTPILAAFIPIIKGARMTVHEAMNSYGLDSHVFGQSFFDWVLNSVRGLPRPLLLSLRNTFRRKGRLLLVMATLTLASAIFVSVLSVKASLTHTVDDALRYWQYDVNVRFGRTYRTGLLEQEALQVAGVVQAEGWGFTPVVRLRTKADPRQRRAALANAEQSDNLLLIAPPIGTKLINPIVLEGRWLLPEDGNAVVINTDLLQTESDLRVGDELVLNINDKYTVWRIVGLVKQPLAGPYLYVNYPAFASNVGDAGRVSDLRIVTQQRDAEAQLAVAQALELHFAQQGYQVATVFTTTQERAQIENTLNIIVTFLLVMALFLALVGGLGLTGVMSINVLERTREIGIMRAIGASNGSVMQIVIVEGVVIGLLSWLLGSVLAWPLGNFLSNQVGLLFLGTQASYTFAESGAWLWLAIMTSIAALASYLPAANAVRLTVRETLAYE